MRRHAMAGILGLLVQTGLTEAAQAAPVQWRRAAGGNDHLYEVVHVSRGIGWVEAHLKAAERGCGWHLATITSAAENQFVFSLVTSRRELLINGSFGPWLGGFQKDSRKEPAGSWRWITDERLVYKNWERGEPNNSTSDMRDVHPGVAAGQHESFMHLMGTGKWNDLPPTALLRGYVLERSSSRC